VLDKRLSTGYWWCDGKVWEEEVSYNPMTMLQSFLMRIWLWTGNFTIVLPHQVGKDGYCDLELFVFLPPGFIGCDRTLCG
jgi:hypothetical protein